MGPFFARLADFLAAHGQAVHKVNFNGGDALFFRGHRAVSYTGSQEAWPAWLSGHVRRHRIDAVVVFGQMRWMHRGAGEVARFLGIPVYVFEEGYVRPDYVTLERDGVNARSTLPRNGAFYLMQPPAATKRPEPTRQRFRRMAAYATAYSLATMLAWPAFHRYRHHRSIHPLVEAARWTRGGWRKLHRGWVERHMLDYLTSPERSKQWFLLPLQVHNDAQVHHHWRHDSVESLIDDVVASFARHALPEHELVIKHHPMDRAYKSYARHIDARIRKHRLQGRVHYVHDQHLPTLLKHALGVVTLNSTVGLQALHHGAPVLALGECVYAVRGLVSSRPLDAFWQGPGEVDQDLYKRFRAHLVHRTQVNASFYGEAPAFRVPATQRPARSAEPPARSTPQPLERPPAQPLAQPPAGKTQAAPLPQTWEPAHGESAGGRGIGSEAA